MRNRYALLTWHGMHWRAAGLRLHQLACVPLFTCAKHSLPMCAPPLPQALQGVAPRHRHRPGTGGQVVRAGPRLAGQALCVKLQP